MDCLKVANDPVVNAPCRRLGDEARSGSFRGVEAYPGSHGLAGLKEARPLGAAQEGSQSPKDARAKISQVPLEGHLAGAPQSSSRRGLDRLQAPWIHAPEVARTTDVP